MKASCFLIFLFAAHSSFAQYGPFWGEERNMSEYSFYDEYLDIIQTFNQEKNTAATLNALDSLAQQSLKQDDYQQFLLLIVLLL